MLEPISPWLTITSGTPIRATSLLSDPTAPVTAHALVFQQCPGNSGVLYVFNLATGDINGVTTGTCGIIPAPSYNQSSVAIILPHLVFSIPNTGDSEDAANYWVDGSQNGDKVAISRLIW